jgi:hypothetical protein
LAVAEAQVAKRAVGSGLRGPVQNPGREQGK